MSLVSSAERVDLTARERAVLLTIVYADLFDQALHRDDLRRYLVLERDDGWLGPVLSGLDGRLLEIEGELVTLRGRGGLREVRADRRRRSAELWPGAEAFARRLSKAPFVRFVGVCGSLAVENPGRDADVDLCVITDRGRLWTAQAVAMSLKRAARAGAPICPNYFRTLGSLELEQHNLFTAREVAQLVPLVGGRAYREFLAANRWVEALLPGLEPRRDPASVPEGAGSPILERVLSGRVGELLESFVYRVLFAYYAARLRPRGVTRPMLARAYARDRQEVVGGGYAQAVAGRFAARAREVLGPSLDGAELERLFPREDGSSVPLYGELLAAHYGGGS